MEEMVQTLRSIKEATDRAEEGDRADRETGQMRHDKVGDVHSRDA